MTIDKEYLKKLLNQYADVAMAVNAIKQEVIREKELENDDIWSYEDQHTIKTYLNFGITRLLDEYIPKNQN